MPNVTNAKPRGVAFDPRSLSQLAWLTTLATINTGRAISGSTILRLALSDLSARLSGHVKAGRLDALRADLARLPEFARCAPAGIDRATDQAGQLVPWQRIEE
jgi:hypothetical protein